MLAFTAAGMSATVVIDYDEDGIVDQTYSNVSIDNGDTAFDLLDDVCSSLGYWEDPEYGAFIYEVNGVTANWDPDEEWWMFTYQTKHGPVMSDVGVSSYVLENKDTIGMWFVSGNHTSWPYGD